MELHDQDQALLLAILETAVDAIIVINGEGTVQTVNTATCTLFGYAKQEMKGQNVKMLMPEPFRSEHDQYLRHYRQTGQEKIIGIGREVVGRRKDGSTFPIHLAVSKLAYGDELLFAGIVRDISDLKQTQQLLADANERLEQRVRERTEELREAQAELLKSERLATLGQVSGGIAHEIRNPLNAVRTSVYYLRNAKNLSPEKRVEHLERIDRQVSLIDNVITALSDVARLPEPNVTACELGSILSNVVSTTSIPGHVNVKIELPDSGVRAVGDPNQLSIVFRNLIRNARDAMPDGGTIFVTAERAADDLVIHVTDTGVGIEDADLKRVTEPLFSTKARGMGLGLAISVAILQKNQGSLSVQSQAGRGSTFSVHLKPAGEQPDPSEKPVQ